MKIIYSKGFGDLQLLKMCKLRVLEDLPMTMRERESGENACLDIQHLFEKNAPKAEVLSMYINGAEPYRKKKAITKIFRRSKYIPQLEDIEENPEITDACVSFVGEETRDLSLAFIHLERAMSAGIMAQESRRRKRKVSNRSSDEARSSEAASPRRERRNRRRSSREEA